MAEFTTAKWDTTNTKTGTPSSLTVEKKGVAKNLHACRNPDDPNLVRISLLARYHRYRARHLNCSGGTELEMFFFAEAQRDGVTEVTRLEVAESGFGDTSPSGIYGTLPFTVPYTNGSGATPSTITFNKTVIGSMIDGWLTLTGTLKVTNLKNEAAKIIP